MKLTDLERFDDITIQIHDNPDADAVGSGYAVYRYFKEKGKKVRLVYGGRNEITKSNIKLLTAELDIPLEYVRELEAPELLITVDCQYGQGNVQKFEALNIAMIDHHSTGKLSDEMSEIRSNLVSCATVCYSLLKDAGFDVNEDVDIATALYYGLYMDSNHLSEISHPLDYDMVDFLKYDKRLISRLKNANFSLSDLETAGNAVATNNLYLDDFHTGIISSAPCDPNILGLIGDLVIQVDTVDVCVIYNEMPVGYKLSVRSSTVEVAANELAAFLTTGIGDGGGHLDKAGGFIDLGAFRRLYPDKPLAEYLTERIEVYYEGFDSVYYTDGCKNPEEFARYRKKQGIYGYVRSEELFEEGTECRIRTLEGDVFITCGKDTYIMIGILGEVYPISESSFNIKYRPLEGKYAARFEYEPAVINNDEGASHSLMPYARRCESAPGSVVLAKPLEKYTKVFTRWDYDGYMVGREGDMLCYTEGDMNDVYISKKEIFEVTYEKITK
ncbi:MAG: DHH family phosphoesterase [Bacteroides sp.]|nr:DHH family phosphoesterase [Bacteroides sp.]